MKKLKLGLLAAIGFAAIIAFAPANSQLTIGEKAPMADTKMKDISGKMISLNDEKKENGLLVIFSCNTCPFVIGWEDQYSELGDLTAKNNMGMILVNSNEAKRSNEDSMSEMVEHAEGAGYNTPYVVDADSKLANAMGAKTTPHVYLFDSNMKLVYRGAINDKFDHKDATAKKFYLNDAINELAKGKKISTAETTERGCSIKRVKA